MTVRPILIAPHPDLKRHAEPVAEVNADVLRLMDDMLESMYAANGIGLAAPQVGVLNRVIVIDVARPDEPPAPLCLANPEILWQSPETVLAEEGCLSLPDQFADVVRSERIRLRFVDRDNRSQEIEATGLLARCIQHEVDHLEGTLFVDHVSALKRNIILRRLAKSRRHVAAAE
ncbi:MAG: peptide deformylase [Rhodospirillales bacterium]|nr:MAG: peptide deformylase [Rhodospirillales bacterium]